MIPATFAYYRPTSLSEALDLKARGALCLAGGTDVVVKLREEKIEPSGLLDLKALAELRGISVEESGVFIGATVPVQDVVEHPALAAYQAFIEGAGVLGCYEVRQRATIGGNICNASASADTLGGLLVYGAQLRIASPGGCRSLPLDEFLLGPGATALADDEILLGVFLPAVPEGSQSRFFRASRVRGMDLAGMNVALYCEPAHQVYRIAIGAVWPRVRRATEAEDFLAGKPLTAALLNEALEGILKDARPRESSLRATPEYKKAMIRVFIERGFADMMGGDCS